MYVYIYIERERETESERERAPQAKHRNTVRDALQQAFEARQHSMQEPSEALIFAPEQLPVSS